jgi:hypothetical protein
MSDTSPAFERMVREHYAAMTEAERMGIVSSMRQTAIAIIESSLPEDLTREQRRYQTAKRFYGNELPEAALLAYASYPMPVGAD